jgi:hypothetical protein
MSSSDSSSGIDKETLYKEFTSRRRWQDKLFKSGCHKALDIPEDDMNLIQQSHGIGGKHLLGIGAMVLAGLLGWRALTPEFSTPAPPTSAPAPQEYDVTFWVDGEEITVTEPKE